jgi:hypothetical protein
VTPAVDGACNDRDHRGLRRLVTEFPKIEPGDTSWAGQDVALLYLEKQRLLEENRELRLGRARSWRDLRDVVVITSVSFLLFVLFLLWLFSFVPRPR